MSKNEKTRQNYSEIEFFEEKNLERYEEYHVKNPDMDTDEIVWRVNNNLDKEKYEYDVLIENCDSLYVVVNKYFKLPEDFCPKDLVDVDGILMRSDTAAAYKEMCDAAKAEGLSVSAVNSYRSVEKQREIYERFLLTETVAVADETCARPGYSEHHTGLAVDVQGSIPGARNIHKTPEGAWVRENCYKYGFIIRYLPETVEITGYISEPWHLRYVGKEVSKHMRERNIKTLEEYVERFLKSNK